MPPPSSRLVVSSDVGGTFTDTLLLDRETGMVWSGKSATRPREQEAGVVAGAKLVRSAFETAVADGDVPGLKPRDLSAIGPIPIHNGSTVATNALLERRGAKTAFVTNAGFEDLIAIRRQDRPDLYDLRVTRPAPLVPPELRFGLPVRRGPDGEAWAEGDLDVAISEAVGHLRRSGVEAVAVGFLHADLYPDDERRVANAIQAELPAVAVVASHDVWPEMREVERFETTIVNAYLMPLMAPYLRRLDTAMAEVFAPWGGAAAAHVMDSSGALRRAADAARLPASLLLSGPAGGARAAAGRSAARASRHVVSFDVGGTSTDVSFIVDGMPLVGTESRVGGFACRFPATDVHSLGAGGGSVLWRDPGGHLQVGPQSQGAVPGPACYGRGGEEATMTDALLLAGRIPAGLVLGDRTRPDRQAAWRVVERLAGRLRLPADQAIVGAIRIAVETMAAGVRVVTTHRGHDPRGATIMAFGGAGPLLAAELSDALGASDVVVPWDAGTWSARGMATAPVVARRAEGLKIRLAENGQVVPLVAAWKRLAHDLGGADLSGRVAARYAGQSHELEVPVTVETTAAALRAAFAARHRETFGHVHEGREVELVRLLVERIEPSPDPGWSVDSARDVPRPDSLAHSSEVLVSTSEGIARRQAPVVWRGDLAPGQRLGGPLVVPDATATTFVPPGWHVAADPVDRALVMTRDQARK